MSDINPYESIPERLHNCPNCGGTLQDDGKCRFCGSVVYDFLGAGEYMGEYTVLSLIDNAPPVEPRGKLVNHRKDYGHNIADCSVCGHAVQWHDEDEDGVPRFCWFCGTKIDSVED